MKVMTCAERAVTSLPGGRLMPRVSLSLGHLGASLLWGLGQLKAEGQGGCSASYIGQTTMWAPWGNLVAREKKQLLWPWWLPLQEERAAPQAGGMAL